MNTDLEISKTLQALEEKSGFREIFARCYTPDQIPAQIKRYTQLLRAFQARFHHDQVRLVRAPGRINLIGEHTDYNGCPVLPIAINRDIIAAFQPNGGRHITIASLQPGYAERRFELAAKIQPSPTGDWGNYAKAAVQGVLDYYAAPEILVNNPGMDILIDGEIPPAAGMSSSSAVVVLCALSFLSALGREIPPLALAALLAKAEHYVGTQGGGMDQAISLLGQADCALKISFNPLSAAPVTIPPGASVIVAHSGVQAAKTEGALGAYNRRVSECRLAVALLRHALQRNGSPVDELKLIGDFSPDDLTALAKRSISPAPYRLAVVAEILGFSIAELNERCLWKSDGSFFTEPADGFKLAARFRHVFSEWMRVREAVTSLQAGDLTALGNLMYASHASCRDDYEVSCPELDRLVEIAHGAGALGARLTGAGFGGCTVTLSTLNRAQEIMAAIEKGFYQDPNACRSYPVERLFVCRAVEGAGMICPSI